MNYELYIGDARGALKTLPEHRVDSIITSPPYFGLRAYKAEPSIWDNHNNCEHEWVGEIVRRDRGSLKGQTAVAGNTKKGISGVETKQGNFCLKCNAWRGVLGSEPTTQLYIKHLIEVFELCKRVLKPTGSLWVNIDDSYSGSGGAGGDYNDGGLRDGQPKWKPPKTSVKAKSLYAVPERFIIAMIDAGWIYRETIIWQKPSCMPESVKDRCTRDFEYLYHFTMQGTYYFERQFEPYVSIPNHSLRDKASEKYEGTGLYSEGGRDYYSQGQRNKRSVWAINPEPQKAVKKGEVAHYAAFPTKLCTTPILASVPEFICTKCGKPRMKIYENGFTDHTGKTETGYDTKKMSAGRLALLRQASRENGQEYKNEVKELGLSDCGCGEPFEPGIVLDPFAGTGTVAVEAIRNRRSAILIDVSVDYASIIKRRLNEVHVKL